MFGAFDERVCENGCNIVDIPQMNLNIAFVQKSPITYIASMHWLLFAQQITQIVCVLKIQTAADCVIL